MTIYIVTTGQYSDYDIQAVFSTEALADAYVRKEGFDKNKWSHWDILDMKVDEECPS